MPRRLPSVSMTTPAIFSGTSITTSSNGSIFCPSTSCMMTCGWDTCSSNPSRRMFSSKIAMCISPRPYTLKLSPSEKSTFSPTFTSSSLSKRSLIWRVVTNLPSFPANGESLTRKFKEIVGSSMAIAGNASWSGFAQSVSPISIFANPAIITMSPALTDGESTRSSPLNEKSLVILPFRISPVGFLMIIVSPTLTVPS